VVVGATVEEAGFNKEMRQEALSVCGAAVALVPELGAIREAWAGLRPRAVDGLPILGGDFPAGLLCGDRAFSRWILLAPERLR